MFVLKYIQCFINSSFHDIAINYQLHVNHDEVAMTTTDVTLQSFAECCLKFLSSYLNKIHLNYCQTKGILMKKSSLQVYCMNHLLTILHGVMVANDVVQYSTLINTVMIDITHCHVGAMALLEWKNIEMRDEEDDNNNFILSKDGLADFTYLLIVKKCCSSYLPKVIHPIHLYQVGVLHVIHLLSYSSSHPLLTLNGLVNNKIIII